MAVKAKKKAVKKAAPGTMVRFQVFGNSPIEFRTKRGTLLGSFLKTHVPKGVDLKQFELRVDGKVRAEDYILNEGDEITLAPHVAGGNQ